MKNKLFTVAFICLLTVIANIGYNTATYWLTEQNDKADLVTDSVSTADTATPIILDSIALAPCTTIDPQMYFNGTWFHVEECNQFDEKGNKIKTQQYDEKGNLMRYYTYSYYEKGNKIKGQMYDAKGNLDRYYTYS